jgi:aspartyl aminopeptidase
MKTVWDNYTAKDLDKVMSFSKDYIEFLNDSKTEREAAATSIKMAEAKGFKPFEKVKKLKAGDKVYFNNRGKSLALFVIGKESLSNGLNILGAHIDSPRLDLKPHPLYESEGLALFDTHYYGGIKKYQWVATPLALHGVVCKKDGTNVNIVIGEDPSDPVVGISDLLPHLAADQMQKPASKVIEGEDLNVCVGSIPKKGEEKDPVKAQILDLLKEKYGIEEDDFVSAEIEVVPAGKARDYGLDRSMVHGYGHDDRICAFTSLRGLLDVTGLKRTCCCILTDKEEVGSQGSTGAQSHFFQNCVAELLDKLEGYNDIAFRKAFSNSYMLSSDVTVALDPNYPSVSERNNSAFLGKGLSFAKYTGARGKSGCNDANPEFVAKVRKALDDNKVPFQTGELGRVDVGGGGTIAYILANMNMEVLDAGIPLHNMHALYEVASKADIYEAYNAYKVFLKDLK